MNGLWKSETKYKFSDLKYVLAKTIMQVKENTLT